MIPVDGSYLYKVGAALAPLDDVKANTNWPAAWLPLYIANSELQRFVNDSVFKSSVRSSRENAEALITILKGMIEESGKDENKEKELGPFSAYRLTEAVKAFQVVMTAEFRLTPLFLVTPKRGYDLAALVYTGSSLFPDQLHTKVPEAIDDLNQGARCLAFEMLTASAFHFHRANEAVLRKYWEAVLPGRAHPGNKTLGDYLRALGKARKGSPKVKASLRDIKNLYRNPVSHPDYQVKDVDEAIALVGSIHTAIVQMMEKIPFPPAATSPTVPTVAGNV